MKVKWLFVCVLCTYLCAYKLGALGRFSNEVYGKDTNLPSSSVDLLGDFCKTNLLNKDNDIALTSKAQLSSFVCALSKNVNHKS